MDKERNKEGGEGGREVGDGDNKERREKHKREKEERRKKTCEGARAKYSRVTVTLSHVGRA